MCRLVYVARTNIDIDDDVIERVRQRYGLRTKRETVDFALRRLLIEPMTVPEVLGMQGTGWEGNLDEMRSGTSPRT